MVLVKIHHNFNVRLLLKLPLDLILKVTCFKKKYITSCISKPCRNMLSRFLWLVPFEVWWHCLLTDVSAVAVHAFTTAFSIITNQRAVIIAASSVLWWWAPICPLIMPSLVNFLSVLFFLLRCNLLPDGQRETHLRGENKKERGERGSQRGDLGF